jgi:hypothetical protein
MGLAVFYTCEAHHPFNPVKKERKTRLPAYLDRADVGASFGQLTLE